MSFAGNLIRENIWQSRLCYQGWPMAISAIKIHLYSLAWPDLTTFLCFSQRPDWEPSQLSPHHGFRKPHPPQAEGQHGSIWGLQSWSLSPYEVTQTHTIMFSWLFLIAFPSMPSAFWFLIHQKLIYDDNLPRCVSCGCEKQCIFSHPFNYLSSHKILLISSIYQKQPSLTMD